MKYYIHQNRIFAFAKALPEGYKTSEKYEDINIAYLLLNDKQTAFYEANKTASVYEIWNMQIKKQELTVAERNEIIRFKRQQRYETESDPLYMAWQKYLALGEPEKAEEAKQSWTKKIQEIETELPYVKTK
ncbi:hypothetical protein D0T49_04330 [Paludibacter sp. 221]|uniref:hypothetical protein n=1 Tax=Paludibacter sp. 221 TaxID=2302939 RepID=UPI0013D5165C|nr:hypothetical protein [Paludibacter sp. 221]NDV46267.1 hypothetical protein [Paludibacter sp. 221]